MTVKQFCRNIKNLYSIIRYFGFSYLDSIYYNYKQDKDIYEDFGNVYRKNFMLWQITNNSQARLRNDNIRKILRDE